MQGFEPNTYTIAAGLPLAMGVPIQAGLPVDFQSVPPRLALEGKNVFVRRRAERSPFWSEDHMRLLRAVLHPDIHRQLTMPRSVSAPMLLLICREGLEFEQEALTPGLTLWSGGHGSIRPRLEHSIGRARAGWQLYELEEGQHLFVVDGKSAVVRTTCLAGAPNISTATASEIGELVRLAARNKNTDRAAQWVSRNLAALQLVA